MRTSSQTFDALLFTSLLSAALGCAHVRTEPQVGYTAHFEGGPYTVSLSRGESCSTPCDLSVTPGRHRVSFKGEDTSFDQNINFPAAPSVVSIEGRVKGYTALAVTSLSVGVPLAAIGALVAAQGLGSNGFYGGCKSSSFFGCGYQAQTSGEKRASEQLAALAVAGSVVSGVYAAVGAGVGFSRLGHNRATLKTGEPKPSEETSVRLIPEPNREPREEAPLRLTSLGATPTRGGALLGATFAF